MMDILEKIKQSNVTYHTLGQTDRSAMPLGNGELCVSVWTNEQGEICFYLSRSDALTELDRTVKLGMVKLRFSPDPFTGGDYVQTLDIADGNIHFTGDSAGGRKTEILMCVDTAQNQVLMEGTLARETQVQASVVTWRTAPRPMDGEFGARGQCAESADIVRNENKGILFYHKNGPNIIAETAALEEVSEALSVIPDALTNRIFGGYLQLTGNLMEDGTEADSEKKAETIQRQSSAAPKEGEGPDVTVRGNHFFLRIRTESMQGSEEEFLFRLRGNGGMELESKATCSIGSESGITPALARCKTWWNAYWENSYIFVNHGSLSGVPPEESLLREKREVQEYETECRSEITNAYLLTRFMLKCCGTGAFPIYYNGMLFNLCPGKHRHFVTDSFGETCTAQPEEYTLEYNPDERSWCVEHLWQNIRHPYHTFLVQGETESMKVLFSYYRRFWDINRFRAKKYFGAEGQHNTEMTLSFALPSAGIYGVNREGLPAGYTANRHGGAVDISPGLELLSLMLDYYDYTGDGAFFKEEVQVYARDLYRYIETRFCKRIKGKMVLAPLHAVETYWEAVNPIPTVAGLWSTVKRLLTAKDLEAEYQDFFIRYQEQIPELPTGEEEGARFLKPAEKYADQRQNVEIPELYACFPFDVYNQFTEGADRMKRTFEKRIREYRCNQPFRIGETPGYPSYSGWQYQGIVAARLGMTDLAKKILSDNVQMKNPGTRFPAMWGPIYDGVPDTDHGANIVHLLQEMVMQTHDHNIYLLPAFPAEWDVAFKLHPDGRTTVEAEYEKGVLKELKVTPESERKRIKILIFKEETKP